uniref:Loxtox protein n=1 Tax=Loxosceles similis TaxID=321804 RepID=A0A1B2ASF7_LOXSM|nr:loxtox protein [Loxosceles similis]
MLLRILYFVCLVQYKYIVSGAAEEKDVIERDDDGRRPVWNIAHMTNDIEIVKTYLDDGANALEFDIEFNERGQPLRTYHGVPCDCCRKCGRTETFSTFMDQMRKFTTPGDPEFREKLVLLMLDLKVKDFDSSLALEAGQNIAKVLLDSYWQRGKADTRAYIVLSIPSLDYAKLIRGFYNEVKKQNFPTYRRRVGVDFSGNDDLDDTRRALERVNITRRIWQSDGITNCLPRGTGRLAAAIKRRDDPEYRFINKVYYWSVDRKSTIRTVLDLEADGMITNFPDNFASVLNESKYASRFRLANYMDNPWKKFIPSGSRMIQEKSLERISQLDAEEFTDNTLAPKSQNFLIPFLTELFFSCGGKGLF